MSNCCVQNLISSSFSRAPQIHLYGILWPLAFSMVSGQEGAFIFGMNGTGFPWASFVSGSICSEMDTCHGRKRSLYYHLFCFYFWFSISVSNSGFQQELEAATLTTQTQSPQFPLTHTTLSHITLCPGKRGKVAMAATRCSVVLLPDATIRTVVSNLFLHLDPPF